MSAGSWDLTERPAAKDAVAPACEGLLDARGEVSREALGLRERHVRSSQNLDLVPNVVDSQEVPIGKAAEAGLEGAPLASFAEESVGSVGGDRRGREREEVRDVRQVFGRGTEERHPVDVRKDALEE